MESRAYPGGEHPGQQLDENTQMQLITPKDEATLSAAANEQRVISLEGRHAIEIENNAGQGHVTLQNDRAGQDNYPQLEQQRPVMRPQNLTQIEERRTSDIEMDNDMECRDAGRVTATSTNKGKGRDPSQQEPASSQPVVRPLIKFFPCH